jgi:Asp-tRNA(Asn)/Glu-tRNA(Gln) amidotransferase A subunit family amidase
VPIRSSLSLMVSMVRDGAISPSALVEEHLRQIEARNPAVNAFAAVLAEEARAEARACEARMKRGEPLGLLHGVPVTVKDSFDMAGLATRSGSRLRPGTPASADAAAVARLRAEGAIILGRTNTPDLAASYESDNLITGRSNNPWDLNRTPGGSSGGEAAAIAAFCSPGGIGTDGGGSIRVPAHFCGVAGLKPTPGRVPTSGHFPALGYPGGVVTVAGPMAREATDLRLLFSVLAGYDPADPFSTPVPLRSPDPAAQQPPTRIGVWEQFYDVPVDAEIRDAVRRAGALLHGPCSEVFEFAPQGLERAPNVWAFLFSQWPSVLTRKLVEGREAEAHWTLLESLPKGEPPSAEAVLLNLGARDRMRAALLRQMEKVPVLLMPACGIPAFRHRERRWQIGGREIGLFQAMMPAVLANVLGLPAVTVPMGLTGGGLPIGVQLVGRPFEDEVLLEMAIRLEESRGPFVGPPAP